MRVIGLLIFIGGLMLSVEGFAAEQTTLFGYYLNTVTGGNMSPTLEQGERVYSDPDFYDQNNLQRGDIILFRSKKTDHQLWVSRVVGLPGEIIALREGDVYINGTFLTEGYVLKENNRLTSGFPSESILLPEDSVFVMGDNRDNSKDSRYIGFVKVSDIEAKVLGIYMTSRLGHLGGFDNVTYNGKDTQ